MHKLCLLTLTSLAACAPGNSERLTLDQVGAECDARALGSFVGQLPTKENALKLMGRISAAKNSTKNAASFQARGVIWIGSQKPG